MTRTRLMTIAAGFVASVFAGAALASAGPDHEPTDRDHTHHSSVEVVTIDNGDKYELIIKDDKTIAKVNGIRVADELVKTDDDKVIILDDNGDVLKELRVARVGAPGAPGQIATWTGNLARLPEAPNAPLAQNRSFFGSSGLGSSGYSELGQAAAMERPPVMLGVLLETPGEALRAQLGVSEHALLIEKVMDGLPADKAGLKQWDIIIEVDGDEIDEPGMLGEILMESEPGDELELVIIRGGKEIERELTLAAYDADRLGITISVGSGQASSDQKFPFVIGRNNQWTQSLNSDTKRSIDDAMKEIEKLRVFGDDAEASQKLREHLEHMQRQLSTQAENLNRSRSMLLDSRGRLIVDDDEREAMADELEHRLEKLEDQFEDRLESLEDQLEARWERMEDMLDRMFDRFEQMLDESRKDRE